MNDIRRTILWVIFGFSMVLLWDQWQVHNGKQATFFPSASKPAATATAPVTGSATPVASAGVPTVADASTGQAIPGAVAPPPPVAAVPREQIVVNTDVLKLTFDSEGGSLIRTEFVKLSNMADKSRDVVLLDETKDRFYVAQSGLIGGAAGALFPTHKTPMTVSGARDMRDGENELVITFTSPEVGGAKLVKTVAPRRLRHGSHPCRDQRGYNASVSAALSAIGA
jgi:YidC/Oxa1 family membrane protein insertase